ncbi:MAG TPA: permease-like cell division protein FtsX [Acidimicrobiales bacterium]
MPVSVGYISKEAGTNLWRNRLMTIAAVLTVAVSLALVGSVLLLKQGASNATTQWQQGVDVAVFVKPGASPSQYNAIGSELKQLPYVKSCTARSQNYDLAEAKRLEPPDLSNTLTVASVPSSWRCSLMVASQATAVIHQFTGKPGVFAVSSPTAQIRTMENVIHVLQWVFLSVAVVLLLSASVLILNTIRMAIFARRREVSVMKLVGATNWFIRLPFMAEGLVQGLLGGSAAVLAVLGLYWGIGLNQPHDSNGPIAAQMAMGGWEVVATCILVMVIGVGVGVVGSAFAVRRFLDV